MKDNAKFIYHASSIMLMVAMFIMWVITPQSLPETRSLAEGIFVGWAMQYGLVNFVFYIDKKGLIK